MPINTLAFKTKFTDKLDKELAIKSVVTKLLDASFASEFKGAKTVSIPDVSFNGMLNYDRDNGFSRQPVTVARELYTLSQDRQESFLIDREDMDEIGIASLAGQMMSEFVRTQVVPEMDAYSLSKIASYATTNQGGTAPDASTVITLLNACIGAVQDKIGYGEGGIVFVNPTVWGLLNTSTSFTRILKAEEFKRGEINTQVWKYNDFIIQPVPQLRMYDAYTFATDGTGSVTSGFEPTSTANIVDMIALPMNGASVVKKTEKIRTFSPDELQTHDAYKFDYRLYYDTFVKKNMRGAIAVAKHAQ